MNIESKQSHDHPPHAAVMNMAYTDGESALRGTHMDDDMATHHDCQEGLAFAHYIVSAAYMARVVIIETHTSKSETRRTWHEHRMSLYLRTLSVCVRTTG